MARAGGDEPNLELPSFFGRRRKRQRDDASAPTDAAPTPEATPPAEEQATGATAVPAAADASAGLRPASGVKRVPPPRREPAPPEPAPTRPVVRPRPTPEPAPEPAGRPAAEPPAPVVAAPEPAPSRRPSPQPAARTVTPPPPRTRGPQMSYPERSADEPTSVLTATRPGTEPVATDGSADEDAHEGVGHEGPRRRTRRSVRLPHVSPWLAAALSGAVAALLGVVLAWLALRGCDAVRGVSSCGGGPGLLALLGIVVVEVLAGAALLRALGAPQPGGTSLVGVGLVVVVAMFFPATAVTSVVAAVVLPVATALTFVLAHVVATTVVDLGD